MDGPGLHAPGLSSTLSPYRYAPRIPPMPTNCADITRTSAPLTRQFPSQLVAPIPSSRAFTLSTKDRLNKYPPSQYHARMSLELIPGNIRDLYEVHQRPHACAVLKQDFPHRVRRQRGHPWPVSSPQQRHVWQRILEEGLSRNRVRRSHQN